MSTQKMKKETSVQPDIQSNVLTGKQFEKLVPKKNVNKDGFSLWVRTLLINWRQGTVSAKGRSSVNLSGKKPWRQKGTGRARAGTARSPLWRGGGVTFGPKPRVRKLAMPQKVGSHVLNNLLWQYLDSGSIVSLKWQLDGDSPKTSQAHAALKRAKLADKKINLFLQNSDALSYSSFANLPNVRILFFDQANAYDLVIADTWVVLEKDVTAFTEMVQTWL